MFGWLVAWGVSGAALLVAWGLATRSHDRWWFRLTGEWQYREPGTWAWLSLAQWGVVFAFYCGIGFGVTAVIWAFRAAGGL